MSTEEPEVPADSSGNDEGSTSPETPEPPLVRPYADIPAHMVEAPAVLTASVREVLDRPTAGADKSEADAAGESGPRFSPLRRWLAGAAEYRRLHAAPLVLGSAAVAMLLFTGVLLHQFGTWPFSRDANSAAPVPDAKLPLPPATGTDASPSDRPTKDKKDPEPSKSAEAKKDAVKHEAPTSAPPSPPETPVPGGGAVGGDQAGSPGCDPSWQVDSQWEHFSVTVRITNSSGKRINGWEVSWTWPGDQHVVKYWNADVRQSGNTVTAGNVDTNAEIATTGEASFGLEATGSGDRTPQLTCRVL